MVRALYNHISISRMRAEKAEQEAAEVKETLQRMGDRMLVMEELLLQIANGVNLGKQ